MKKALLAILSMVAIATQGESETINKSEFKLSGLGIFPGQDEDWKNGFGASAQWIFWQDDVGLDLSIGVQQWEVNDEIYSYGEYLGYGVALGYAASLEGDATMVPIGASILYMFSLGQTTTLTIDGGVRYVFVNSNVKFNEAGVIGDAYGNEIWDSNTYDIEADGGIVGLIGANVDIELSKGLKAFAGGGYQFDIVKGATRANGIDLNYDNELKAAYVQVGFAWDLNAPEANRGTKNSSITQVELEENVISKRKQESTWKEEPNSKTVNSVIRKQQQEVEEQADLRAKTESEEARLAEAARKAEEDRNASDTLKVEEQSAPVPNVQATDEKQGTPTPVKAVAIPEAASMTPEELVIALRRLKTLRDEGVLTEEEYAPQQKELMRYYLGVK